MCFGRGLTLSLYYPVVTTELKHMVASLNFMGNGPDDLVAGAFLGNILWLKQPTTITH